MPAQLCHLRSAPLSEMLIPKFLVRFGAVESADWSWQGGGNRAQQADVHVQLGGTEAEWRVRLSFTESS